MTRTIDRGRADRSLIDVVVARAARIDRGRTAARWTRANGRVVLSLLAVLGVVGAVVTGLALALAGGADADPTSAAGLLMAGLAVSAGSAAALMMVFAARLTGSPRTMWAGVTIGWYSLLAIPISTVRGLHGDHQLISAAGSVVVHAVAIVLCLLVLAPPPPRSTDRLLWSLLGGVPLLVAAAVLWVAAAPASAAAVAGSPTWWLACALAWVVGGLVVVARASFTRVPGLAVVGAGFAMVGAAQAVWFLGPTSGAGTVSLSAFRLLAVVVVLGGGVRIVGRALLRLSVEQALRTKELRRAELRLARAAERDHDLRNGLAGLAGATAVLGGGADTGALCRVVAGELRRLDGMLAEPGGADGAVVGDTYAVAPALDGLVMLRRSVGMDVRADVEPCLGARGSASTLAQVVTNLLANAERHAPGSPVRIAAARRGDRVEIRVRDFGPGVQPGRERAVLEPGTRDEGAGGLGLGLHVCRTLLAAEGATIEILPADARSPGCVVVLGLPAGEWAGPQRPRPQRGRDTSPVTP